MNKTFLIIYSILLIAVSAIATYYLTASISQDSFSGYKKKVYKLSKKSDSFRSELKETKSIMSHYRDSLTKINKAYKDEVNKIDSVKYVYKTKKIPAIDSFTADSIINYLSTRYDYNFKRFLRIYSSSY